MFKKGNIVICIDNDKYEKYLEINKKYIVESHTINSFSSSTIAEFVIVKDVNGAWSPDKFRTLSQLRKEKIKKLLNEINR